jgi:hypothetical protein
LAAECNRLRIWLADAFGLVGEGFQEGGCAVRAPT